MKINDILAETTVKPGGVPMGGWTRNQGVPMGGWTRNQGKITVFGLKPG